MRFAHLHEQIYARAWYISPAGHTAIRALFEAHLRRADRALAPSRAEELSLGDLFPQRQAMQIGRDGIARIHVFGPLGKGLSKLEQSCGATGFEQIRADYDSAAARGARGVLLVVNSPGGTILGTPETAELIANSPLPTVAYTEDVMASAAYYISAGAQAIIASLSADVGSIGVYIPWVDQSAAYAAAGLRPEPIVNTGGDLKATGFGGSLTEAQRTYLQESVDADFAAFRDHVRAHRPFDVPDSAMRGQVLSGETARAAGLIDAIGDEVTARAVLAGLLGVEPDATPAVSSPATPLPALSPQPSAPAAADGAKEMHIHLTLPQISMAAPQVTVNQAPTTVTVDARTEKDAIAVHHHAGAKRIITDAAGNPTAIEPVPAS